MVKGVYHYLGRFRNIEEATKAYDEAAVHYFGEFACINGECARPSDNNSSFLDDLSISRQ